MITTPGINHVEFDDYIPCIYLLQRRHTTSFVASSLSTITTVASFVVDHQNISAAIEGLFQGRCLGVAVGRNEWKTMVEGGRGQGQICMDKNDVKHNTKCDCSKSDNKT